MLPWISLVVVLVAAYLTWNLSRRLRSDRITALSERRRAASRFVSRGELVDGNRHLAVALALTESTFFVNSLAHFWGKRTYNADVSARDNWAVALLTLGEGYHSFHHRFPADFRNGLRWFQWDPAKWFITALRAAGLVTDLRATPPPQVQQARMNAEIRRVEPRLAGADEKIASEIRRRVADAKAHLDAALTLWRQHAEERTRSASSAWRNTRRTARLHMREARREWKGARIASWSLEA